ncbi:iron ABC transporter permease [Bacillus carboniphilus]|uniref:Iron ABC transporter permease n=1 Tax=Bacillus carboniphilus TaxID=86663 RepID=A0ABY9JRI8_9BACI|nr:iron ABC transporter permease [Bacillus carboniphilus]WLR41348.1 iron ABC transporter permease [Bacillus carboniphilus]
MNRHITVRAKNHFSFLVDVKALITIVILIVLTFLFILSSAAIGEKNFSLIRVFQTFLGNGSSLENLFILSFRMPRIIMSLFVGICLAVAGTILQNIVKNPLASPDVIGITGGASLAVVIFLTQFSTMSTSLTVSIKWLPAVAITGAFLTGLLIYIFAWSKGISPIRLVLIGIGISLFTQSLTTLFMISGPLYQAQQANVWITGTVATASWEQINVLFPVVLLLMILSLFSIRMMNIQELGDTIARGTGNQVQLTKSLLFILSVSLTGMSVAFAGAISFVGLIAPHIARKLVGSMYGALLPVAALVGGMIVIASDLIGRTLFAPIQVPAGVFTAAIGAPYFLYLLYSNRNV